MHFSYNNCKHLTVTQALQGYKPQCMIREWTWITELVETPKAIFIAWILSLGPEETMACKDNMTCMNLSIEVVGHCWGWISTFIKNQMTPIQLLVSHHLTCLFFLFLDSMWYPVSLYLTKPMHQSLRYKYIFRYNMSNMN